MAALARVLRPESVSNRLLRLLLAALALAVTVASDVTHLLFVYPFGVDLEIPLRAAERWRAGGDAYQASAFLSAHGATQPFLYPPYVLPPVSLLVELPRFPVLLAWSAVCVLSFIFICRRLALPAWAWPFVALWPSMLEPLIGGNVQLPAVALFCAVFWVAGGRRRDFMPIERTWREMDPSRSGVGILAAMSAALKVSQPHAWLAVLRRRPRDAAGGLLVVAAAAALTLPITGLDVWVAWTRQLARATDPTWELGGIALARLLNPTLGLVAAVAALVIVATWVPRRLGGAWVGLLSVVGAISLHTFGTLFLLPALLAIRRELALVAAMLIATTTYEGTWAGILVVATAMAAGLRWPAFLEPIASEATAPRRPAAS